MIAHQRKVYNINHNSINWLHVVKPEMQPD